MLNDFSEIGLSVVKNLNTRILNISLQKLAENDTAILPPNDYIPKIWENRWYNDDTIAGYSKGDLVWKWTMDNDSFIANFAGLIQDYASKNQRLSAYFKQPPSSWSTEKAKYQNIISGYSENAGTTDHPDYKQIFPMLFDYCWNYSTGKYDPPARYTSPSQKPPRDTHRIEIYISLADNNKSLLSDTTSWKNVTIRTAAEQRSYLSNEISSMFNQHIKDYHLGGVKTADEFESLLLKKNFANFNIDNVYNANRVNSHDAYVNSQGFDYVTKFGKKSYITDVKPNTAGTEVSSSLIYRWYRLWNSGYLEHGGTIEFPKSSEQKTSQVSDYTFQVDLNWAQSPGISAPVYDYPETKAPYYENAFDQMYFAKTGVDTIEVSIDTRLKRLGYQKRYAVSLTPVTMVSNDISASTQKIASYDVLSSLAYPSIPNDDRNNTWLNFEVHDQTNENFKLTRSNTRDLTDLSTSRYVQYYVTGYLARPNRNYNLDACEIRNLAEYYAYTGSPITLDDVEIYTNDGELLERDVHYIIDFQGQDITNIGLKTFRVSSIYPYKGSIETQDAKGTKLQFRIAKLMTESTHTIECMLSAYSYGVS